MELARKDKAVNMGRYAGKYSTTHWADHMAEELIEAHPEKSSFVCASGISPSGVVHIGNFREVITVDLVVRSLRDRGKKVRFIYSWDDSDALRKLPKNLPDIKAMEPHLRKALAVAPDPYGKEESYATHFEKLFESEIGPLGISPEFIYQYKAYQRGDYADGILHAYKHQKEIAAILDEHRTESLEGSWSCVSIFCKECKRDTTEITGFTEPSTFQYTCKACKKSFSTDIKKEGGAKLLWRVDWPMRWAKVGVDFEPGGKDHSSQGGSYETGAKIIRKIWKKEPPAYLQYDFVLAKGLGAKLSSSAGQLLTLSEAMEVYEPAIVRWLFASRKPNLDFSIAFDLDVIRAYDDFDRMERTALGLEEVDEKKLHYERRIYEFSLVSKEIYEEYKKSPPSQFQFRHLSSLLQIHQGDAQKAKSFFKIKNAIDEERYKLRAKCCWTWITKYAPEDFRFSLRTDGAPKATNPQAVKEVVDILQKNPNDEEALSSQLFEVMKKNNLKPKPFFEDMYQILIGKPQGPKLASFLLAIGPEKAASLLSKSL